MNLCENSLLHNIPTEVENVGSGTKPIDAQFLAWWSVFSKFYIPFAHLYIVGLLNENFTRNIKNPCFITTIKNLLLTEMRVVSKKLYDIPIFEYVFTLLLFFLSRFSSQAANCLCNFFGTYSYINLSFVFLARSFFCISPELLINCFRWFPFVVAIWAPFPILMMIKPSQELFSQNLLI